MSYESRVFNKVDGIFANIYNIKTTDISKLIVSYIENPKIRQEIKLCPCTYILKNVDLKKCQYLEKKKVLLVFETENNVDFTYTLVLHIYHLENFTLHYGMSYRFLTHYVDTENERDIIEVFDYNNNLYMYLVNYNFIAKYFCDLTNLSAILDPLAFHHYDCRKKVSNDEIHNNNRSDVQRLYHNDMFESKYKEVKRTNSAYEINAKIYKSYTDFNKCVHKSFIFAEKLLLFDADLAYYDSSLIHKFYKWEYDYSDLIYKKIDMDSFNDKLTLLGKHQNYVFMSKRNEKCQSINIYDMDENKSLGYKKYRFRSIYHQNDKVNPLAYKNIKITKNAIYLIYCSPHQTLSIMNLENFLLKLPSRKKGVYSYEMDPGKIIDLDPEMKGLSQSIVDGDTHDLIVMYENSSDRFLNTIYLVK